MLLQFAKITLIAQFHAIIWMQNIVRLNSHSLILLVPLAVSLSIMNQGLHIRWNAAIVKMDPFFKSYFQWSSAIQAVFIVCNQRHYGNLILTSQACNTYTLARAVCCVIVVITQLCLNHNCTSKCLLSCTYGAKPGFMNTQGKGKKRGRPYRELHPLFLPCVTQLTVLEGRRWMMLTLH